MTAPLSPAAQAVIDAIWEAPHDGYGRAKAAAALRAAADHVDAVNVPAHIRGDAYWPYRNGRDAAASHLLAIAAGLERADG